jgi:hypothetical protein
VWAPAPRLSLVLFFVLVFVEGFAFFFAFVLPMVLLLGLVEAEEDLHLPLEPLALLAPRDDGAI